MLQKVLSYKRTFFLDQNETFTFSVSADFSRSDETDWMFLSFEIAL